VNSHNPTRLYILGDKGGVEKGGATKKRNQTSCVRRRTGGEKDKPLRGERASTKKNILGCAVNFLQMHSINAFKGGSEEAETLFMRRNI